ncbi:MAG: hypothetical protein H0U51_00850 [Propionibacteriales bacterium]|nr:hypothetical protein [Propionibacteriales bacterium]
MASEVAHATCKLAGLYTYGRTPDPETEAAARRELATAKIERAIREAIAAAPPLTNEQRERIASLLASGGGNHG